MRFYTKQHKFYCGIDLHARTMYVCALNQAGEVLLHRNMKASPEPFLKALAPYRQRLRALYDWRTDADYAARMMMLSEARDGLALAQAILALVAQAKGLLFP